MRKEGDEGFTLLDTLMASVVMMIVTAIFTSSVLFMYRTAGGVEAKSATQTRLALVLQKLDREVRYARGISKIYNSGTYVDFLSERPGQRQCVQLRLQGGVLAQRTWTYQQTPINLTAWTPLATQITTTAPFTYIAPTMTLGYQQLTVALAAGTGAGREANAVTFTALNSDRSSSNDYCSAARAIS